MVLVTAFPAYVTGLRQRFMEGMSISGESGGEHKAAKKVWVCFHPCLMSAPRWRLSNERLLTVVREWLRMDSTGCLNIYPLEISALRRCRFLIKWTHVISAVKWTSNEKLHKISGISCKLIWKLLVVTLYPKKLFTLIPGNGSFFH